MKYIFSVCVVLFVSMSFLHTVVAQEAPVSVQAYIDRVAQQDKERLPDLGIWLAQIRATTMPGTATYRVLTQSLAYVRTVYARVPAPAGYAVLQPGFERILDTLHMEGLDTAPIRVIEFADFQCPYCQRQSNTEVLENIVATYPADVRVAFAHFPLGGEYHLLAEDAAIAAECVWEQGGNTAFYAYKNLSFRTTLQPTQARILTMVRQLGLDEKNFTACQDNPIARDRVLANRQLGISLGVSGTPYTTLIDSRSGAAITLGGVQTVDSLEEHIDIFLAQ